MRQLWYPRSFYYVARLGPIELSPAAHNRLRWLKAWQRLRQRGYSGQAAAEILRLPRATLYRWQRRLEHEVLKGLEERSRRPKRVRRPQWSPELAQVRKPRGYAVEAPGDIVQVDTLDVRPLPGVGFKHFTGRDVVS